MDGSNKELVVKIAKPQGLETPREKAYRKIDGIRTVEQNKKKKKKTVTNPLSGHNLM